MSQITQEQREAGLKFRAVAALAMARSVAALVKPLPAGDAGRPLFNGLAIHARSLYPRLDVARWRSLTLSLQAQGQSWEEASRAAWIIVWSESPMYDPAPPEPAQPTPIIDEDVPDDWAANL